MTAPANNTFINEALPLYKDIKFETEQENVAEMTCFFLPPHVTETDKSSEHEVDLEQPKEESLDAINGDIEKDPLAIEETNVVKLENLKVENESELDLVQLKEEPLDIINGDIENYSLAIEETNVVKLETLKVENERQVDFVQRKEEPLDIINGDVENDPLAIEETDLVKSENLTVENERVIIDK
ncbi:uncharacterized protein LOC142333823 isoform X2 [Lycorma delicatula]|uniref:uncharacterized protein LOC142333823 isoform X2 n=1 Tax=Lycorma delicatula TaxID=130591 RepID=UPI003F513E71